MLPASDVCWEPVEAAHITVEYDIGPKEEIMDKTEDKKKKKKIHGTFVKVTDENIDEVAKMFVEKIRQVSRSKGH